MSGVTGLSRPQSVNWNYPTSIRFGAGRVAELGQACEALQIRSPLVVTDRGLGGLEFVSKIVEQLKSKGLNVALFSEVKPNPTDKNVSAGVTVYREGGHDGVIALGGGSSLDAGKAIALMVGQDRPIWDFEDVGDNWTRVNPDTMAPVCAVPTTAGTGSEVGRASVISDPTGQEKKIIFHPAMLPQMVIADPQLTLGLSPPVTAATGMDALSHNFEALCAPFYHPMAEGIALEAMRLIYHSLPECVASPENLEARAHMMCASLMGATAFQKGLGAIHALAHPLGACYDLHHGLLNAVLMPYVVSHNRDFIKGAMVRLSDVLGLTERNVDGVLQWLVQLRQDIGIPHTLDEIGVPSSDISRIAEKAVKDPSSAGNPKVMDAAQYEFILQKAFSGDL